MYYFVPQFSFITVVQRMVEKQQLQCRLYVSWISVKTLTFVAGFPQTDFDTKLVNFFLKAPRVSKVNFLLTISVQCINKREGYENKQNDHSKEKSFISFINKFSLLILEGGFFCGGQSGDCVFAFCCLRVIKIIGDIELVH